MLDSNSSPLEKQLEGLPYTVGLLLLRRNGYNFTCTFLKNKEPGFAYSKEDHHIFMALEVTDDVRIVVLEPPQNNSKEEN